MSAVNGGIEGGVKVRSRETCADVGDAPYGDGV